MDIHIISHNNGVGLSRDTSIMRGLLENIGHTVHFSAYTDPQSQRSFDLNIFNEVVNPIWFEFAKKNILIPNPEWYDNDWRQYLAKFDMVLVKTRAAEEIFRRLGLTTKYISFTSEDRYLPEIPKDDLKFFHCAGLSAQKSTEIILRTWERNPNFPLLTILQHPGKWKRKVMIKNVNHIYDYLNDQILKLMQNNFGVHLCPSETEGFGHYIMEALGLKAIILTTNAPPMNEMVTQERGVLCNFVRRAPQRLATNYYITEGTLEQAVRDVMRLTQDQKDRMRENSRRYFVDNDTFFKNTFIETINGLLK
jgi:hypothetical protein